MMYFDVTPWQMGNVVIKSIPTTQIGRGNERPKGTETSVSQCAIVVVVVERTLWIPFVTTDSVLRENTLHRDEFVREEILNIAVNRHWHRSSAEHAVSAENKAPTKSPQT